MKQVAAPSAPGARVATSQAPSAPRTSSAAPAHGGGHAIAIQVADDDDDDMQIERSSGGMPEQPPMGTSTRPSSVSLAGGGRPSGSPGAAGTGLQLGAPVRASARRSIPSYQAPTLAELVPGYALSLLLAGGAAAGLFKVAHRAGGVDLTALLPHAFDGSSATESGVIALLSLVVAIAIGFVGLRLRPHAWTLVGSSTALLLLALAMVTVTLASTGENPTPPDGVLLVPYLLPAAVLLLAVGVMGRAGRRFADRRGAARAAFAPIALAAGAIAFAAGEASRLLP
jgi:hypothetical protein